MALSQAEFRTASVSDGAADRETAELETLVGIGITIAAAAGQTIVLEGDPCSHCFRVLSGAVRLHKGTADGRRQLIDFLIAGDCFGLIGSHHSYGVEAITQSTLVKASRAALAGEMRERPGIAERLVEHAAAELARAHEHMLLLGRKNAQEKVASLLVDLARRLGADSTRPTFRLPISRQEMADQLGLTIETVSRTMTRLKQEGFIALPTSHDVVLTRPAQLAELADPQEDLSFDERDSAPFMPKCQVIDPAFTWGGERAAQRPWHEITQRLPFVRAEACWQILIDTAADGNAPARGLAEPGHVLSVGARSLQLLVSCAPEAQAAAAAIRGGAA